MAIKSLDKVPSDHFSGGRNLTTEESEGLSDLLNGMRASRPRAFIGLSAAQNSNLAFLNHIQWDTANIRGDLISISSGTGQQLGVITLKAGYTYAMTVSVGLELSLDTVSVDLYITDRTQNDTVAADGGIPEPRIGVVGPGSASPEVAAYPLSFEFTPTVDTDLEVSFSSISGGSITLVRRNSWWLIEAIEAVQ